MYTRIPSYLILISINTAIPEPSPALNPAKDADHICWDVALPESITRRASPRSPTNSRLVRTASPRNGWINADWCHGEPGAHRELHGARPQDSASLAAFAPPRCRAGLADASTPKHRPPVAILTVQN